MEKTIGAEAAKLAGLQIDQNQKLRNGQMTIEQMEWWLKQTNETRERITRGCLFADRRNDRYSKTISPPLSIPATDGKRVIANVKGIFAYTDPDFKKWDADEKGKPTEEANVIVREMTENATFSKMFGELSSDLTALCLTQDQIISFVENHRDWLRTDGWGTFFLFKSYGHFFVAGVGFRSGGRLEVYVRRFEDGSVWDAVDRHRVVVPQLA